MVTFATEFPVRSGVTKAAFVAQVVAWLRGNQKSIVLDEAHERDLDGDEPVLRHANGEQLFLRVLSTGGAVVAMGVRHDIPDIEGRLWRTEAVLRRAEGGADQDLLRLRTHCIAQKADARLDVPRKPFLLKSVLKDGWGADDGRLPTSDQPHWLGVDNDAVALASSVSLGEATYYLPTVYISATGEGQWAISRDEIDRLAYQLGGVAHVVVEPDRGFSFRLRDACEAGNVYGGAIGVILPGRGVRRKFYRHVGKGQQVPLHDILVNFISALRAHMPSNGWDWTELQEQALRQQRQRDRARLSPAETEALYDGEISALKDQISQLKDQLAQASLHDQLDDGDDALTSLTSEFGPEVYPGELQDRLRCAATVICDRADQDGLDPRSKAVLQQFARLPRSEGLTELLEDLKRATKEPGRLADQVTDLMSRHGYKEKSKNRHVRLEPREGFVGLDTITVPTSPSDIRGLKNMRKQIERTLGLTQL
ncbi:hypothetical protein ABOZ73_15730 [Caulobacter sp. 73W]|uniref:Uncharacterized protein n=1 Tax=Caulobacter sp. 73W TaxID=3161137 RepID=A0AB39KQT0_9CAUL